VKGVLLALTLGGLALALVPGLPEALDNYQGWTRLNPNRVTENPSGAHPASKDIYINLEPDAFLGADGSYRLPFADGTRIVKERSDTARLLVARLYLMEKEAGRWRYGVFDRREDGSFVGQDLGTNNFCHACHGGASERDFVFTEYARR
jgi:hypothetical protein